MAISVEAEARGAEERRPDITNQGTSDNPDHEAETSNSLPQVTQPPINTNGASGTYLIVQENRQLPSPFPTPSPRNSSSPLPLTDLSGDLTSTLASHPNGRRRSASLQQVSNLAVREHDATIAESLSVPKPLSPFELHDIPEEKVRKPRKLSVSTAKANGEVLKLSAADMEALTSAPESLPITSPVKSPHSGQPSLAASPIFEGRDALPEPSRSDIDNYKKSELPDPEISELLNASSSIAERRPSNEATPTPAGLNRRPGFSSRSISAVPPASTRMSSYSKNTPRQSSPRRKATSYSSRPEPLELNGHGKPSTHNISADTPRSPIPQNIPLPPMSIPTYLQLELSSSRPSPLYIYRSANSENPYESSKIKFERLLNFLLLPPQLEQVLYFGSLACLDAWLYTFTILPLRFVKAAYILISWWFEVLAKEARFILGFIYHGAGRFWHRQREGRDTSDSASRSRSVSRVRPPVSTTASYQSRSGRSSDTMNGTSARGASKAESERRQSRQGWGRRHRRSKSVPSSLSSRHKADLLQGAVIIFSCLILLRFDASRMYHSIRGQAAIKLYVIYNVLEVFDKLFSALGQDIFECLFSDETLERDLDGRSKILRPLGMFMLALIYNVIHAAALFYQVITLNVAVNSYSNALLTLLMSNQFVEIKSTVFKMFQKDNIFQMTCADIVERFQLWLMLTIIALRNIVEVGGLSILATESGAPDVVKEATAPLRSTSILPNSFTILPSWSGEVLSPFLLVLGSEMLVDWIKHAYISKFNRIQPAVYQRYLDVLAKDYYTNAFVNQNLIKRLGLPVIPLSCLFIRSSVQTYHMFLATHLPPPLPSTATALSVESATSSPATTAALEHFDNIIRKALGRSTFGIPDPATTGHWYLPSADDVIATLTMLIFFLGAFFVLLACKLVLGMLLLKFARNRYRTMKKREHQNYDMEGKRLGIWGMVEMEDEKRRHIFEDDPETLKRLKEKERLGKEKAAAGTDFSKVSRYEMSAKRIW